MLTDQRCEGHAAERREYLDADEPDDVAEGMVTQLVRHDAVDFFGREARQQRV